MILRAHGRHLVKQWNTNFQNIWEHWSRPADGPGGFRPDPPDCPGDDEPSARALTTGDLAFGGEHWEAD
jgi:hypothetical protein